MLRWFQALMPREDKFFGMFAEHAEKVALAAAALRKSLDGGPQAAGFAAEVSKLENEADAIAREVLLAVRRSFITPFDRSDITALTTALDDAVDQMQRTVKKIALFDFTDFKPEMLQIADVAVEAADVVVKMVAMLPDMRDKNARIAALNVELTRLEEKSDELHDSGVTALYKAHRTNDPMAFIIGTEIFDHLEKVLDRLEDVGSQISGIVIENL
jgi:hypothetical protein